MTLNQLKRLAKEVLGGTPQISHGKAPSLYGGYYVNTYGPGGRRDVRVTANDKDTAIKACAAALEAM